MDGNGNIDTENRDLDADIHIFIHMYPHIYKSMPWGGWFIVFRGY